MTPVISDFFDNVMVMVEDERVKNNRLSLLNRVVALTAPLANFSLINSK
jgi:glycyl-tRNA synthetase beta chain